MNEIIDKAIIFLLENFSKKLGNGIYQSEFIKQKRNWIWSDMFERREVKISIENQQDKIVLEGSNLISCLSSDESVIQNLYVAYKNEKDVKGIFKKTLYTIAFYFGEYTYEELRRRMKEVHRIDKIETSNKNPESECSFKIRKGKDISASDFFEDREINTRKFNDYYYERHDIDEKLLQNVKAGNHTIITGKPLAGKTRAIYELINKKIPESNIVFYHHYNEIWKEISISKLILPKEQNTLFIFDEIDKYFKHEDFWFILKKILDSELKLTIICTCQTSMIETIESSLLYLFVKFCRIHIEPIKDEKIKEYISKKLNVSKIVMDDTIGSCLLPLCGMKEVFKGLSSIEREILRAYKCFRLIEIGKSISAKSIKEYCYKRLNYPYNNEVCDSNWERSLSELYKKEIISNLDDLNIEEVYLEKFLPILRNSEVIEEMLNYYPDVSTLNKTLFIEDSFVSSLLLVEKMIQKGIVPDLRTLNKLMLKTKGNIDAIILYYYNKKLGIKLDLTTYKKLLILVNNEYLSRILYNEMKSENIDFDSFTYSILLENTRKKSEALEYLDDMRMKGLRMDIINARLFIDIIDDYQDALPVIQELKIEGFSHEIFIFTNLIDKISSLENAKDFVKELENSCPKNKAQSEILMYNLILQNIRSYSEAEIFIEVIKKDGLLPDKKTYLVLIEKVDSCENAMSFMKLLRESCVDIKEFVEELLLYEFQRFEHENVIYYDQGNENKIFQKLLGKVSRMNIYRTKINHSTKSLPSLVIDLLQSNKKHIFFQKLKQSKINPEIFIIKKLFLVLKSYNESVMFLSKIMKEDEKNDNCFVKELINKAKTITESIDYLNRTRKLNIETSNDQLNLLICNSLCYNDALKLVNIMVNYNLSPDSFSYFELFNKVNDQLDATSFISIYRNAGFEPDFYVYENLIDKVKSYDFILYLIKEIKFENLEQKRKISNFLIYLSPNIIKAKLHFEEMIKAGIIPDVQSFNAILKRYKDFEEAIKYYELMRKYDVKPNLVTFIVLFEKNIKNQEIVYLLKEIKKFGIEFSGIKKKEKKELSILHQRIMMSNSISSN
ncbi:MAG: hypothetical protein A2033_16085 [Bacteroidetes bacterium GWA2_31_9]|nr:MAG: hypothetical protein A2033_16085 [Bacteroidetes bacterium GWA2_31_9]